MLSPEPPAPPRLALRCLVLALVPSLAGFWVPCRAWRAGTNLAMVSSGAAFAYRQYLRAPAMALPTWGLRPRRNGSSSHPPASRLHGCPISACGWIRGACWQLQRPEADLSADRQLRPRPGAAEAGAQLPRQERRWGGLRIDAVSLSVWGNPSLWPPVSATRAPAGQVAITVNYSVSSSSIFEFL